MGLVSSKPGFKPFRQMARMPCLMPGITRKTTPIGIAEIRVRFIKITQNLGSVVDTQVFAPYNLCSHVQRLYGVIYFEKRPLWLRAEYYSVAGRSGLISLEFSLSSDDILPLTWATAHE